MTAGKRSSRRGGPHIRDVAAHAGVSVATVSRVLSGSSPVSSQRRERVLAAVAELGFRPSSLARSLSTGRTGVIGVVAPFLTYGATVPRLRGITQRIAGDGHELMVFNVESPRERADAFAKFARRDRLDGLIVISLSPTDSEVAGLHAERLPTVLVGARHPALSGVSIDNVAGGELATAYLLDRGHTRIGFVGDAPSPLGFTAGDRRYEGYRRALAGAGIRPDPAHVWQGPPRPGEAPGGWRGPHSRVDARDAVARLLDVPEPPTALFAVSDMQAIGALEAARQAGVKVPSELAVVGFDDSELAEIIGLTTVHQPLEESGAEGARILLEALAGERNPVRLTLPLRVVERETA